MADGRHFEKTLNAISLMKFGMMMHLSPLNLMGNQKFKEKFQNPRWQTAAILKIEKSDIPETVCPILTKFCMMAHISPAKLTSCSKNQTFKNPR